MRRYSLPPLLPDVAVLHPVRSWLPHRVAEVFVLGRLDSIADPPATKRVGEILSRATKENGLMPITSSRATCSMKGNSARRSSSHRSTIRRDGLKASN